MTARHGRVNRKKASTSSLDAMTNVTVPVVRRDDVAWRSGDVYDCPLCGTEVRSARTRRGHCLVLTADGDMGHHLTCRGGVT